MQEASPASHASHPLTRTPRDLDPLRRQLNAELTVIFELLRSQTLNDQLTSDIQQWADNFRAALLLDCDANSVMSEFKDLLSELLVDPITRAPLNEGALLGSDGRTYNDPTLAHHEITTTDVHPVIIHLIQWLLNRNPATRTAPSTHRTRVDRLMARQRERELLRNRDLSDFTRQLNTLQNRLTTEARAQFTEVHERHERVARRQFEQIEELSSRDRERQNQLNRMQEEVGREIEELDRENKSLKEQITSIKTRISGAERERLKLKVLINDTKKAIRKRDRNNLIALGVTLATLPLAAWALPSLLSMKATEGGVAATITIAL